MAKRRQHGLPTDYYGGAVDSVLMHSTDVASRVSLLPFTLVFPNVVGHSIGLMLVAITLSKTFLFLLPDQLAEE